MGVSEAEALSKAKLPGGGVANVLLTLVAHGSRLERMILQETPLTADELELALTLLEKRGIVGREGGEVYLTPPSYWKEPEEKRGSEAFEAAWALYPKRHGNNPKLAAQKAWHARVKEGESELKMLAAVKGYARHVRADGKEGTTFVMAATTFFGPSKPYDQDWEADAGDGDGPDWLRARHWDRGAVDPEQPRFTQPHPRRASGSSS